MCIGRGLPERALAEAQLGADRCRGGVLRENHSGKVGWFPGMRASRQFCSCHFLCVVFRFVQRVILKGSQVGEGDWGGGAGNPCVAASPGGQQPPKGGTVAGRLRGVGGQHGGLGPVIDASQVLPGWGGMAPTGGGGGEDWLVQPACLLKPRGPPQALDSLKCFPKISVLRARPQT